MTGAKTVDGFTGDPQQAVKIYVYKGWYASHGALGANQAGVEVEDGMHTNDLKDQNTFYWGVPIECEEDLITAVNA